jgi:AraC-like DNA-binding protein
MAPDRITFHDFSLPYTGHAENSASLGIVIPRHRVTAHDRIRARRPMFGWSLTSAKGHLLSSALRALWLGLPRAKAADARPLAAGFVDLVNGLLATDPGPDEAEAVARATARAMKEYLRANLHRPEVGVDDLCRRFRCSRATVYRLFRPVGGVNRFLVDQRLKRCLVALTDAGPAQALRVRDVAEAWGFDDPAHFSRRFTCAFGMAPSEAKALRRHPAAGQVTSRTGSHWQEAARLRQWFEQF